MKIKFLILGFLLIFSFLSQAQISLEKNKNDNDLHLSMLPYYNFGKGLGLTAPDSLFQLNIRFRIQNRVSFIKNEDETGGNDWQIRRLRLRFDGFVGNPKFLYVMQLSFAPGDTGPISEGDNYNIIRDAVVMYRPNAHWNYSFGQTKLPGNRQRINSSGALQLTDRSINNARFNIDRDFGFQIHNINEFKDRFSYNFKAAVSTGEGRNTTNGHDTGLAYTGKVEVMPFGSFIKDGTNFEGDLFREKKPKLLLSGAFQQNNHAQRSQGQLGVDLFEQRTLKSVLIDGMLKYNGFAAMASYMSRTTNKSAITYNPLDLTQSNYVFVGNGFDYQLSYITQSNYEIIARYSLQKVGMDIHDIVPNTKEYTIGLTKYIWEHAFKLQTEFTYDVLNYANGNEKNNWYFRFQIEMGI
ncbi:porin [Flavobacterium sp.]|uniref:porin n=1 Tax=Flavobacterium sp. TaxID=239 RepID=UPI0026051999|nr:porin [Flavobacterium sp.]